MFCLFCVFVFNLDFFCLLKTITLSGCLVNMWCHMGSACITNRKNINELFKTGRYINFSRFSRRKIKFFIVLKASIWNSRFLKVSEGFSRKWLPCSIRFGYRALPTRNELYWKQILTGPFTVVPRTVACNSI